MLDVSFTGKKDRMTFMSFSHHERQQFIIATTDVSDSVMRLMHVHSYKLEARFASPSSFP